MKVKRIDLDDDELPERVFLEVTRDEAMFLALLLGRQTGTDNEQVMPGGGSLSSDLYLGLTGGVFNRFYEDGVDEAARDRSGS